jgi:sulfite oxidase
MVSAHLNRADEWRLEQGLAGVDLPALDQTGAGDVLIPAHIDKEWPKDVAAIEALGDISKLCTREIEGWKGYVFILWIGHLPR